VIPSKAVLLKVAAKRTVQDIIAPNLRILFCGINPGLYSAYSGHHFARPGNRFWPTLHRAGLVDRRLTAPEGLELLHYGYGLTNVVPRASAGASDLRRQEIFEGAERLVRKVRHFKPRVLAILGVGVFRIAFDKPMATVGRQPEPIGATVVWVLPSPSGLNAHYSPKLLVKAFEDLRWFVEQSAPGALRKEAS
jgi:TDG/mug DNA glycosylase family protein